MVLTVYHDLNVCYYRGPMLNKKKNTGQNNFYYIKLRLLQLILILINKIASLHPNSSYYQMCISKIQKR